MVFSTLQSTYLLHIWCEQVLLLLQFWHLLAIFSDYSLMLPSQNLLCDHIRSLCLDDQRQWLTTAEERTLDSEYQSLLEHLHSLYWLPHICKKMTEWLLLYWIFCVKWFTYTLYCYLVWKPRALIGTERMDWGSNWHGSTLEGFRPCTRPIVVEVNHRLLSRWDLKVVLPLKSDSEVSPISKEDWVALKM